MILLFVLKNLQLKGDDDIENLTLGSLFDGIGGFPLSASKYNIETIWASEIDENCMKLTKDKFPQIIQLGDITSIKGSEIKQVDIISFGSPCNNLSLAGNKKGLEGEESKLFHEATRIIHEMRECTNGKYPRFIVWENVTGALSSNEGQDFRCVIEEISKSKVPMPKSSKWAKSGLVRGDGYSIAWRVINSKYWGVPQSRDRIFLVADFRGQGAGEILFEQERLLGDIEKGKRDEQKTTTHDDMRLAEKYRNRRTNGEGKQITSTIFASYGTKWNGNNGAYTGSHFVIETDGRLRRLSPLECERLMGFPDGWTCGFKDTIRYKMLGNSVVIPCVNYIFEQISKNEN